ncbi:transcriptional regulator, TetR family [Clostridium acidisoli DSM 12555]|uniref:Transcriptional regulator, TetR family n=1 Tax=Clostridium acidisoli DSM 12555 TaxID=1121291 RepID=A0A1W1XS00_9CLOT|nr:TetR family transcriptional regulator [Clostridium acidisoli]SMC26321.1 transcriptional regulator, TetR family [Clostridium acidisoli DSM 12555]
MQSKVDLRIVKTRANIKNTFIELLSEKEFNEITIQNILDKALINRSTFYKYYSDKYELAEQLVDEVLKNAALFINERFNDKKENDLFSTIYKAYVHLYDQRKTILALWKIRTNTLNLYDNIEDLLKKNFMQYLILHNNFEGSSLLDYYSTLYSSLVLTTLKWILTSGNESDIKKILEQVRATLGSKVFLGN